jgi:hypothetical protein
VGSPDQNFSAEGVAGLIPVQHAGTESTGHAILGPLDDDSFIVGGVQDGKPLLLRFSKNGMQFSTFGTAAGALLAPEGGELSGEIRSLAQQSDGKLIIGMDGDPPRIGRLELADAAPDESFGEKGFVSPLGNQRHRIASALVLPDDSIIVVGNSKIDGKKPRIALTHLSPAGERDSDFDSRVSSNPLLPAAYAASAVLSSKGVVVVGHSMPASKPEFTVASFLLNGSLDLSFGEQGWQVFGPGEAQAVATDLADLAGPADRIVVAGYLGEGDQGPLIVRRLWQ